MGLVMKEGDLVVASESKSKLWKDMNLMRAIQNRNVKYVDVAEESRISVESVHQL